MIGPEGASDAVADLLETHLAGNVTRLTTRLESLAGVPRIQRELYQPARIEPRQLLDLPVDDWPAFLVVARRTTAIAPVDIAAGEAAASATVYRFTYELRVFIYARGVDEVAADLARKRLTLAVRETLLEHLAFTTTVGAETVTGQIDPLSLLEEYQDIGGDEDTDDVVASAYVAVSVSLDEVTPHAEALEERAAPATITHPALD